MQSNTFLAFQQAFQTRAVQLACGVINHLLLLEPTVQAHLKAHDHRTVLVRWAAMMLAPAGEQRFTINDNLTLSASSDVSKPADVTVSLLAGLLQAPSEQRLRFIRIEGDALLAQDLSLIAKQLRWDAEHDLARAVGDTPARWVASNAQKVASLFQQAVEQFKTGVSNAVVHYPGWVVGTADFQAHTADLAALKSCIDALASRVAGVTR